MNIALIGYGKMGKAIHAIAEQKGHKIVLTYSWKTNVKDFNMPVDIDIKGNSIRLYTTDKPQTLKIKRKEIK